MADPLSVTASALAVTGACAAVGKYTVNFVKSLREAPMELLLVSNEVNDLGAILNEISNMCSLITARSANSGEIQVEEMQSITTLITQLDTANDLILDLNRLVQSLTKTNSPDGSARVDRIGWARKRQHILRLGKRLAKTKNKLHTLLSVYTASSAHRVQVVIEGAFSKLDQRTQQQEAKLDLIIRQFEIGNGLEQSAIHDQESEENISHNMPSGELSGPQLPSTNGNNTLSVQAEHSVVAVQFQQNLFEHCDDKCNCICHVRSRSWWRSPLILQNILGFFFLHYSGLPTLAPSCDSVYCRSHSSRSLKFTYCLPRWFLTKAAHIAMQVSTYGEPSLMLLVQRRTEEFAKWSLYHFAERGNVDGMKNLLEKGAALLNDAANLNGSTALHFAVRKFKVESVRYLITSGAHPELEDDHGITATQAVWEEILLKTHSNASDVQAMREMFPESKSFPPFELSDVHKVVLEIIPIAIGTALLKQKWRSQVNFKDAWGRTPLHWASRKGDTAAVKALIYSGANINDRDNDGNTPVQLAAVCPNPEALRILIMANADLKIKDAAGAEPIHRAALSGVAYVELIVRAGGSVEATDERGSTALQWAACFNQADAGAYLIDAGVDMNHPDTLYGHTALFSAISSGSLEFVEMLLNHGANVHHANKNGSTLLHYAAEWGDERLLSIFTSKMIGLIDLDLSTKNSQGDTIEAVLRSRIGAPDGYVTKFEQFLHSLEVFRRDQGRSLKMQEQENHESCRKRIILINSISLISVVVLAIVAYVVLFITST